MEIFKNLCKICETKNYVDLKTLCTIKIGGVAENVCYPKNIKELKSLIKYLKKVNVEYFVVGNGSNIVFEDEGFLGVLVVLNKMCSYAIKKESIICECGLNLFALNYLCAEHQLCGMEWSFGIPATVGGAICMNAGAYGWQMQDFVKTVWVLKDGKILKLKNNQMEFGYRKSIVLNSDYIIVKATFVLQNGKREDILQKQKQIFAYRKRCQPYGTMNCGSVFKKLDNESAGKTIDKLGLKGVKIGNIQISDVHANFFINLGGGKSRDLHKLIDYTKQIVLQKTGNKLEEEIIFVGTKKG